MKKGTPQKIALNVKETLEAKELLRQRHLPDGTVENLVRWCLYGPEKKSATSENSSSSNSLNDDSKNGKDVFLWMTNHELMVCSPHLYNTDAATVDQGASTSSDLGAKDEETNDGSSDVEDLDDMRLDVIKLVNRARKQMHRMKKEGSLKPLVSLSHTTKVLSTYAGLGSLANVFRETGALDLILELLWTNDVDTRRAAGRMLRALALHDAGSRAYVLLSLTQDQQDEKRSEHKQHYADFENRSMVMEMFAETASGEEAHAVALDSVQLPQVPGKALFTLMKCYLRVTSLMDGNDRGESRRNQQKLLWMRMDCATSPPNKAIIEEFEVAFAIADLIFELNNVMDWNNKSLKATSGFAGKKNSLKSSEKSVSPPPTPTLFGARLKEMVKAIRKSKQSETPVKSTNLRNEQTTSRNEPFKVEGVAAKPLFLQSSRETPIDPLLLSSLLKSGEPNSTTFRHPSHFSTRRQYAEYVRSEIRPGFRVRACQSYQDVNEGDEGVYRQHNHSTPPVQIFWHRLNRTYWVYWHHIVILGEGSPDDESQPKPQFSQSPESSSLWPVLNGMQDRVKTLYGVQSSAEWNRRIKNQDDLLSISQRDWWVLLFYTTRISAEKKEEIKKNLSEKHPDASHMCCIRPSKEDALFIVSELLKDVSVFEKESMRSSSICRTLIDEIEKAEKKKETEKLNADDLMKIETEQNGSEVKEGPSTSGTSQPGASSSTLKLVEDSEDPSKLETSLEEKAKAAEMGLRLGLIVDEETEKRYSSIFQEKSTYDLAARLWKLRQDSKNLLKISKVISKPNRGGKIVALTCMTALVKSESSESFAKRKDLDDIFANAHTAGDDSDSDVVEAYLEFIRHCLDKRLDGEEEPEMQIKLALTGHLKTIFDSIVRFQGQPSIEYDAVICTSLITRAPEFAKNPSFGKDSTFLNLITVIITSIFSASDSTTSADQSSSADKVKSVSILRAYLTTIEKLIQDHEQPEESTFRSQRKSLALYSALCVLCMVARKDQNKTLLTEKDFALQVAEAGLACPTLSAKLRHMTQRLKGLVTSLSSDSFDSDSTLDHLLLDKEVEEENSFDELPVENETEPLAGETSTSEKVLEFTSKLKDFSAEDLRSTAADVINDLILPVLKKSTSLSTESGKAIGNLKTFLLEFEGAARENNLILFESHWPMLVLTLHGCLEQCVSASNKSLSLDVSSDVISILQMLSTLDKDFAVLLCGLEAKQTISRLQEKHDSTPELNKMASDLCEAVVACERQRNLHNRLLAVVLGGCISTALHCIEEARRAQKPINIPLFDQLLSNLCKGADLELKEDKCYEKLEVSSNPRQLSRLTDGNPKSYWESNGSSGAHWINVYMKKGIIVRKLKILVAQEDSSYMPSRVVVFGGTTSSDVTTQLSCVNVGSTDRDVVILENARRYWPIIRISIRRCQQGGIDTRIHGIEVVGPKPSFWPLLRRQLYIRTSLVYSVQVHSWVADATALDGLSLDQVMKHKILEVPGRLIKAIEFEQQFANEHLPNPESALVLGQACRSAFSNPILHDLLSKPESSSNMKKSLLEVMLDAYVTCNERNKRDVDALIFSSKLRRLLRLAVDLDQGGGRVKKSTSSSGGSSAVKHDKEEHGIVTYGKRVQPFTKRWGGVEVKIARADSAASLATAGTPKQSSDDSTSASSDDFYEPLSYLPQMAEQWAVTIQQRLTQQLEASVASCNVAASFDECLEMASNIFDKYNSFKQWTEDLFGNRSLFSLTLSVGVWKSISALSYEAKRKLCCIFNVILHYYIINEWKGSDPSTLSQLRHIYKQLRTFLLLTVGTNFCDVFEELFVILLLARITTSGGFHFEIEEKVCMALQSCFPSRQPVSLIQDVRYSENLNDRFHTSYLEQCDSFTSRVSGPTDALHEMWNNYEAIRRGAFSVLLLRPGACDKHVGATSTDVSGYEAVEHCTGALMKEFEIFFQLERSNHAARMFSAGQRALTWPTDVGYAVLHDTVNKIDVTAKIRDCLFLLRFNSESEVDDVEPSVSIQTLLEKKVICTVAPNRYTVCDVIASDVSCLNDDREICSSVWRVSTLLKESFDKTAALVDCAIVKIMKHERQLNMDALVEKTIRSCMEELTVSNRVACSANLVRARCEHHIHMGYLVRKENSQLLVFNPDDAFVEEEAKSCEVPDLSGMPSQSSDEKSFVKEFIKNVSSEDQSTPVALNNEKLPKLLLELKESTDEFTEAFIRASQTQGNEPHFPLGVFSKFSTFSPQGGDNVSFSINMSPTTLRPEALLSELRDGMSVVAEVLSQDVDVVEALLLVFEWNSDKLIESFVTDQEKTLKMIGVSNEDPNVDLEVDQLDETCPVCMNPITTPILHTLPCKHLCCSECWMGYLSTKLDQDSACSTTCPIGSCQTRITSKIYHSVFSNDPEKARRYDLSLVRSFVESDRSYSWCHNPKGCDRIVRKSKDGRDEGWCSDCGWQTCFTCTYVEAHYPASCSHMSQWMDDGGYYEGMSEDAQSKHLARLIAKRCPNCQAHIEKNDGCLHMKCIKCSYDFCWRCLQPWRPTHRDYYNCSSKVTKMAQSNSKFIEFNKRCQHHNMAKLFAYSVRDRLLALSNVANLEHLKFAIDLCTKLAHYRRILAYCNVFNFYSIDTDRLNNIGFHSVALEDKTLLLQEFMNETLMSSADIEYTLSTITNDVMAKGRSMIAECDAAVKIIIEFSKQGMKIAAPSSAKDQITTTESGTVILVGGEELDGPVLLNSRPAGMSDEDDSGEEAVALETDSNNNHSDDDDDSDDDVNMYSSDEDDDDNDLHYDSAGGVLMDYDSDDEDNIIPHSDSDDFGLFD